MCVCVRERAFGVFRLNNYIRLAMPGSFFQASATLKLGFPFAEFWEFVLGSLLLQLR